MTSETTRTKKGAKIESVLQGENQDTELRKYNGLRGSQYQLLEGQNSSCMLVKKLSQHALRPPDILCSGCSPLAQVKAASAQVCRLKQNRRKK